MRLILKNATTDAVKINLNGEQVEIQTKEFPENGITFYKGDTNVSSLKELSFPDNAIIEYSQKAEYVFDNEPRNMNVYDNIQDFLNSDDIKNGLVENAKILNFYYQDLSVLGLTEWSYPKVGFSATIINDFNYFDSINVPFAKSISIPYGETELSVGKIVIDNEETVEIIIPSTIEVIKSHFISNSNFKLTGNLTGFKAYGIYDEVLYIDEPLQSIENYQELLVGDNANISLYKNRSVKVEQVDGYIEIEGLSVDDEGYLVI